MQHSNSIKVMTAAAVFAGLTALGAGAGIASADHGGDDVGFHDNGGRHARFDDRFFDRHFFDGHFFDRRHFGHGGPGRH